MNILEQIKSICDGIKYSRDIPEEAKLLAKQNNVKYMASWGLKCATLSSRKELN